MSENTSVERIKEIRERQARFFRSGVTLDVKWRLERLKAFEAAVRKWERPLCDALWTDLHKSYEEAYLTEVSILLEEIRCQVHNIRQWSRPHRKPTPLKMFPSRSRVISEPLGTALIVSPWNYPVQLLLAPLAGAVSSGCTAVLKPSPYVPNVSEVTRRMIEDTFSDEHVAVIQGHRDTNAALLEERWDIIFFTGSPALGRTVMEAAAKNLTPVVLELGGKSPCIVDRDADIKVAARRIAWGKSLNAGQTCIAPDYLMLHEDIKDRFLKELESSFKELLGNDPRETEHFVRIVNDKAFDRLEGYLKDGRIAFGGHTERKVFRADGSGRGLSGRSGDEGRDFRSGLPGSDLQGSRRGRLVRHVKGKTSGLVLFRKPRGLRASPHVIRRGLHQRHDNAHR